MGRPIKDLSGVKFGFLTAIRPNGKTPSGNITWLCNCSACGNNTSIASGNLQAKSTVSCGCMKIKHSANKRGARHPLYQVWADIKKRCYNVKHKQYKDYGGRGITMFSKWIESFIEFRDYTLGLPNCPINIEKANTFTDLYIDRINNNKGYNPGNLRWATREEQNNNRRSSRMIKFKGVKMTLKDAVDKYAVVKYDTVATRLNKLGWSIEDAILKPKT
jgi:hypothetical protein